jgi:hypothetical protein
MKRLAERKEFEYELGEVIEIKRPIDLRDYAKDNIKDILVKERLIPRDARVVIPVGADSYDVSRKDWKRVFYYECGFEVYVDPYEPMLTGSAVIVGEVFRDTPRGAKVYADVITVEVEE